MSYLARISRAYQGTGSKRHSHGMTLSLGATLILFPQMTDSESIRFRDIAYQSGLLVATMRLRCRYTNENEKD
jgi:hypothetical protein